jgi:hypothetical protein
MDAGESRCYAIFARARHTHAYFIFPPSPLSSLLQRMPRRTTRAIHHVHLCRDRALRVQYRKGGHQRRRPGAQERLQQRRPCVRSPSLFLPFTDPAPHVSLLNSNFCMIYRRPQPFKSVLKLRSSKAESLVRSLDLPEY